MFATGQSAEISSANLLRNSTTRHRRNSAIKTFRVSVCRELLHCNMPQAAFAICSQNDKFCRNEKQRRTERIRSAGLAGKRSINYAFNFKLLQHGSCIGSSGQRDWNIVRAPLLSLCLVISSKLFLSFPYVKVIIMSSGCPPPQAQSQSARFGKWHVGESRVLAK